MPRISVVVPVYDVEAYLAPCLQSIARQSERDLEVIVVDDGSADASRAIAERFAERDPRFRVIAQPNGGLGSARNTGVAHARGEFLAFVDGDDVVADDAYRRLLGSLERTGSDLATGNVQRLTRQGTSQAQFLARTFAAGRERTHVTRMRCAAGRPHGLEQAVPALVLGRARLPLPRGRGARGHPGHAARAPRRRPRRRPRRARLPVATARGRRALDHAAPARVGGAARPAGRDRGGHRALPRPRDRPRSRTGTPAASSRTTCDCTSTCSTRPTSPIARCSSRVSNALCSTARRRGSSRGCPPR